MIQYCKAPRRSLTHQVAFRPFCFFPYLPSQVQYPFNRKSIIPCWLVLLPSPSLPMIENRTRTCSGSRREPQLKNQEKATLHSSSSVALFSQVEEANRHNPSLACRCRAVRRSFHFRPSRMVHCALCSPEKVITNTINRARSASSEEVNF